MKDSSTQDRNRRLVTVGVATVLTLVMGAVLVAGFRLATQMRSNITALQAASVLQTYPGTLAQQLTSLRDRLEARAYAAQALTDLRATNERFDRDLRALAAAGTSDSPELEQAMLLWHQYGPVVNPVVNFTDQPYLDTDNSGSSFSEAGTAHYSDVKRAQLFTRENAPRFQKTLAAVAANLQAEASNDANHLRLLLSSGVLAALVLAIAAGYFQITRAKHEKAAREAQEQTKDILKSVKEGFFLLDANYRIGSVWSDALQTMFSRQDFAGLAFEELLKNLVSTSTLATATKYIKLLWGDRAQESLMKSINPLGQLEVKMDNGHGGQEMRYLQFDFHRVMGPQGIKHVLVSVTDITSSVMLAQELQESQQNANSQLDMMLGVMHIEPMQLVSFLDATETGLQLVNAILKEPARTDGDFRKKLDGLFRELHSIKGESSALNLMSIASRVHGLEDMVAELKKRAELSGNDFLPMVLKLDELITHLRGIREMASRLTALRDSAPPAETQMVKALPNSGDTAQIRMPNSGPLAHGGKSGKPDELSPTLHSLAERLANDHRKKFKLALSGIGDVPGSYRSTVKDCLIQLLRNSAVHGIEASDVRRANTKGDVGSVRAEFRKVPEGYELVFEDDGAGILPEQLKSAALKKQLITAAEAAAMDAKAAMALIFRPGFSTQDNVSMDAGRGVGMDVVAKSVYALGGKIGVSTNPGKFTRFKIVLPATSEASTAVA